MKLTDFYSQHGDFGLVEPEQWAVEQSLKINRAPGDVSTNDPAVDPPDYAVEPLTPDVYSESGWCTAGTVAFAIAMVGGVLAATGNLPSALVALNRLSGAG